MSKQITLLALCALISLASACRAVAGYAPASDRDLGLDAAGDGGALDAQPRDGRADTDPCDKNVGGLYQYPPPPSCRRWDWASPVHGAAPKWRYPRVTIRDALAFGADDIWLVADAGTVLHYHSGKWALVFAGGSRDLRAIWGKPNDVWIGGTGGTLLRIQQTGTAVVPSASTLPQNPDIFDLDGNPSGNDLWAATSAGLYRFDGTTWTLDQGAQALGIKPLQIWVMDALGNMSVVDTSGVLWKRDKGEWQAHTDGSGGFSHVAGGLAVGANGRSARFDGLERKWKEPAMTPPDTESTFALGGITTSTGWQYYLAKQGGRVRLLNAAVAWPPMTWSSYTFDSPAFSEPFSAIAPWPGWSRALQRSVLLCGAGGYCEQPTATGVGTPMTWLNPAQRHDFERLVLTANGTLLARGPVDGQPSMSIFTLAGPLAYAETTIATVPLTTFWSPDGQELWLGDPFAVRLSTDGKSYIDVLDTAGNPVGGPIDDIWGRRESASKSEVFVLAQGTIYQKSGGSSALYRVKKGEGTHQRLWGFGSANASVTYAAGSDLWRREGTSPWSKLSAVPGGSVVRTLWAAASVVYVATGSSAWSPGQIHRYDVAADSWTKPAFADGTALPPVNAIWGRSADEVWAVGPQGLVLYFDGNDWRRELRMAATELQAVVGDAKQVWAAGDWNTLLRLDK
jgi:hypothetical protein